MKGKLKYLLFIAAMFVCGFMTAPNVFAATLHQEKTQYYYDRYYPDGSEHSWYFKHYTMDNEVAYCIEPGVVEGVNYPQTNYSATGLPNSIKERLLLIGYYGYTYPGHNTEKYRMATQGMLWDTIIGIGDNTKFSTARYGNGTVVDISAEKEEIERLIAHHYDKPSFNGSEYTLQVGETITITDTNNLLGNYNISVTGANYSVDGNNLTITPTVNGNITVKLTKQMPYNSEYKIFTVEGKQNMMVPGTVDPVVASFKINSYLGSLEMVKADRDIETAQGQATLKGAVYGIYKTDGTEVTRITTDENGYAKSGNVLSYGSYYLKEITPSNGYYLDSSKYDFDSKGQANVSMNVTEEVVTNYVSILKQYEYINGNTEFLTAEKDIQFEISYPDGTILSTITTDKNGYATFDLPFGVWKFHQVNSSPNYEKIYDFYVTVDYESEIKNEVVKSTLSKIDNVAPKAFNIASSSKNAVELAKNGKILFSASVEDANKMLSAGGNKFYGTQISKVPGKNKNLFTGQTKFTKETGLTKDLTKQQLTNVGMNAASMVVGQYYMSEINDKLEDIKNSIDNISNFQDSEYLSKLLHTCSKINEITENQNDILSNEEARKNAYSDIKEIETKCAELLGQANIQIGKNINDSELNAKQYFEKVKTIDEWHKRQQLTQELLLKIGDLRFALANGSEKSNLSHKQFNNYLDTTNKVNNQLELWHNNYINKLGIDVDKHRKKGSLFRVREKTIGLIKEDWNYNKVEDSTIKQISSQIEPKKYNKLISDKKDDVILIQKYKGNYYNVPNDNNELEISED